MDLDQINQNLKINILLITVPY